MRKAIILSMFVFVTSFWGLFAQSYEDFINKSADYISAENYIEAEKALKEAMQKEPANPGNTLLLSNLGTIQRRLGKTEEALVSYSAALGRHPNAVSVLHNRAALFCEIDSLNSAMKDYNAILLINENDDEALYRRGLIFLSRNDFLSAENDFEKIKEYNPDNLLAANGLALIMKRRGEWEKAENIYTDLIYKNKNNSELFLARAECYLEMKKLGRMQDDLNKALSLKNNTPLLYILKGQLNLQQYDKFSAKANFEKALELGANKELINNFLKLCK